MVVVVVDVARWLFDFSSRGLHRDTIALARVARPAGSTPRRPWFGRAAPAEPENQAILGGCDSTAPLLIDHHHRRPHRQRALLVIVRCSVNHNRSL